MIPPAQQEADAQPSLAAGSCRVALRTLAHLSLLCTALITP